MRTFIKVTRLTRQSCKIVSNLDQEFMNNVIKSQTAFLILKELSLRYFEYVKTLFSRLSSQNIEI